MNHSDSKCIFCQIVRKNAPASIVFEDEHTIAFLDKRPLFHGHTLLIPKSHLEFFTDLPDNLTGPFFMTAKMLCSAVQTAMNAEGAFIGINNKISQSVPHLHIHIVPRNHKDGLKGFFWPRIHYASPTEENEILQKIQKEIRVLSR